MSQTQKLEFTNRKGVTLAARIDLPDAAAPKAFALFAHCFSCSKDMKAAQKVSRALSDLGFGVVRFDFTGLGHSGGEFANAHFQANLEDVQDVAQSMTDQGRGPALLVGHSLGGAAVLAAAKSVDSVKAVATIGAPFDPAHALDNIKGDLEAIRANGSGTIELAGRPFTISKEFLDGMESRCQASDIGAMRKPLMVFHSPTDQTVGIENAGNIFGAAKHPKSFISLEGADHLLTNPADATYVATMIAAWATRHIDMSAADLEIELEGQVVVQETGLGKFQQTVVVGEHQFLADEPKSYGGMDSGPAPYDFLLAGLGACTAMTMRMYAERKGLPMTGVEVSLNHSKIHATDCTECETQNGKLDLIERHIRIDGDDLSDENRQKLLEIADKCPVHRSLHSEVKVTTEAA